MNRNQAPAKADFRSHLRTVENFPKEGILFYDISPLIGNAAVFAAMVKEIAEPLRGKVNKIAAFDARGFMFGGAVAVELGAGLVMLRKPGKLPGETMRVEYDLEYGSNALEMQVDALSAEDRVLLLDDVIATGGTALAGVELVRRSGAHIEEFCGIIDLPFLGGSERLRKQKIAVRTIIDISGDE